MVKWGLTRHTCSFICGKQKPGQSIYRLGLVDKESNEFLLQLGVNKLAIGEANLFES